MESRWLVGIGRNPGKFPLHSRQKIQTQIVIHSRCIPGHSRSFQVILGGIQVRKRCLFLAPFQAYSRSFPPYSHLIPGPFQVHSRFIPGIFQVHSRHIPGHSHHIPTSFQAYSRHIPGKFQVNSRCIPGAFQVNSRHIPVL